MSDPIDLAIQENMKDPVYRAAYETARTVLEIQEQMIAHRLEAKLSRAQLAEKMGVPTPYIGRWERGDVDITLRSLHAYFWALGWDVRISLEPIEPDVTAPAKSR